MKTALEELIDSCYKIATDETDFGKRVGLYAAIYLAESLIEKEKQQIVDAARVMYLNGVNKYPITATEYYNETFKNE